MAAALTTAVQPAQAGWQEVSSEVAVEASPGPIFQPSLATGYTYLEDNPDGEPVPITRIAYVDGSRTRMVTRVGGPGEPWSEPRTLYLPAENPTMTLDRNGGEFVTMTKTNSVVSSVLAIRRVAPGTGNWGAIGDFDQQLAKAAVAPGRIIDMPAPPVLQYPAWDLSPFAEPERIHVIYSVDGELWHAHIADAMYYEWGNNFIHNPIGDDIFWDGTEDYDPDGVAGTWPAAAPLWTVDPTTDGPFNYEPMPAVAYNDFGVDFRRAREANGPIKFWTEHVEIGGSHDQRPTIDAVRDGTPHVAWAPSCDAGAAELYFRRAEVREPYHASEWGPLYSTGAENACDPSLSIGEERVPHIAYVDPVFGEVKLAVYRQYSDSFEFDTIDEGSEPSMDYNSLTELQVVAYVDPSSGELRVADGFWD